MDTGIWSDLDVRVRLDPPTTRAGPRTLVVGPRGEVATLFEGASPVKAYPVGGPTSLERAAGEVPLRPGDAAELDALLGPDDLRLLPAGATPWPGDLDGDGIVDPIDILIGAHKTDLNDARYDPAYVVLPSPGGDVPREQGVCTDVIVRSLRNAGLDLQLEVNRDIGRAPAAYPMVDDANDDIDHRRVKTILPWFQRHWEAHGSDPRASDDPFLPGDVIFMETIASRRGPDHIGIVSERAGEDGLPLVVNNWDTGWTTDSLALLPDVEVTHRFRIPPGPVAAPLPDSATHLVAVEASGWDDFHAELRRYERDGAASPWHAVGEPVRVVLGAEGLAWGRGLHGAGAPAGQPGPVKREGDLRSPAGVFALGRAFGTPEAAALAGERVEAVDEHWRCVDDPRSRHYGRVLDARAVAPDWSSAEEMRQPAYRLAVSVEHNTAPSSPGDGSCIFLHQWRGPEDPVVGCTAMPGAALDALVAWIEPGKTVYVALPSAQWRSLRRAWVLPG